MIQFQIRLVYEETSICRLFACFFQASRSFVKDECFFRKYCIIILFHVVLFKKKSEVEIWKGWKNWLWLELAFCQSLYLQHVNRKKKQMKWLWLLIQIVFHWYEVFHRIKRIKSISFTRVLILCVFLFFILIVLLKYYF